MLTCMYMYFTCCLSTCSDTVSRSALFCAIATTIERCKTESVVDIFQVVKALRVHRPGAVRTVVSVHIVHNYNAYSIHNRNNYVGLWGQKAQLEIYSNHVTSKLNFSHLKM